MGWLFGPKKSLHPCVILKRGGDTLWNWGLHSLSERIARMNPIFIHDARLILARHSFGGWEDFRECEDDAISELSFLFPLKKLKWYVEGYDRMGHLFVLRNRRLVLPEDVSFAGYMTRGFARGFAK